VSGVEAKPAEAYPLAWPVGWPRARYTSRAAFADTWTLYVVREKLSHELRLLNAKSVVLSTNIPLRQDGLPYSNTREPTDHGAAVYFRLKGEPRVLACDCWNKVVHNVLAIAKHVEAMRGQSRWGVGSVEQAFSGYKALAEVGAVKPWFEVLGVDAGASWAAIQARRIELVSLHHPDRGGSPDRMAEVNAAFDEARRLRSAP